MTTKSFYKTVVTCPDEDQLVFLSLEDISESSKVRKRFGLKAVKKSEEIFELPKDEETSYFYYGEEYGVTPVVNFSMDDLEKFAK